MPSTLIVADTHRRTSLEQRVAEALDALGVLYDEQVWRGTYQVDFWLPEYAVAVEARGCTWHGHWRCHNLNLSRVARDERRTHRLKRYHGVTHVVPIWGCYVDTFGALDVVRYALQVAGVLPVDRERTNDDDGDERDAEPDADERG